MAISLSVTKERVRLLAAIGGGPAVLRKAISRYLGELTPADCSEFLHHVNTLARKGWTPALVVLPMMTRALEFEPDAIPQLETLRSVATLSGAGDVAALFSEGEAQREYDLDAAARADAKLFTRPLGWLKQQARLTKNPDELARLAVATNPDVVREVLRNSRMTEALVVRIASRRPARPEPLLEIWKSERWSSRPAVRRALVLNPYLPPEIGSKIVPLLSAAELDESIDSRGLHQALRDQAEVLLSALRR